MSQIKNKLILSLMLIFSIFAILAAYFIQYVLGHKPCNLCLIERLPYFFSIIIILICLLTQKFEKITLIILSLIFFIAALLSFYHFGIEKGFIKESLFCELNSENKELTKEALATSSYMLTATRASVLDSSNEVIGFAPIRIKARLDMSIAESAVVLTNAMCG